MSREYLSNKRRDSLGKTNPGRGGPSPADGRAAARGIGISN
jgi:hypothetical protein